MIELLVVIVIIGILAGVIIAVLSPKKLIDRSNEAVMAANLDKIKLPILSCLQAVNLNGTDYEAYYHACVQQIGFLGYTISQVSSYNYGNLGIIDPSGFPATSEYYTWRENNYCYNVTGAVPPNMYNTQAIDVEACADTNRDGTVTHGISSRFAGSDCCMRYVIYRDIYGNVVAYPCGNGNCSVQIQ